MVRDAYKNAGYHVLLVDNGDSIQGEPVGTMTTGEANIKLMNAVGYDIATMGNHEFDYGMERFFELSEDGQLPLCQLQLQQGRRIAVRSLCYQGIRRREDRLRGHHAPPRP